MDMRKAQITELMMDVKRLVSGMAAVDVSSEPDADRTDTVMNSREIATLFQEYHSVTYRKIAQLITELSPDDIGEFKMSSFQNVKRQEYPMWELTERGCRLYLDKVESNRCYGKIRDGVSKMRDLLEKRKNAESCETNEKPGDDIKELFNQFISSGKGDEREIPELTAAYQNFNRVLDAHIMSARAETAITAAVYDIAIESEMQGFIYGFQLFGAIMKNSADQRGTATKYGGSER